MKAKSIWLICVALAAAIVLGLSWMGAQEKAHDRFVRELQAQTELNYLEGLAGNITNMDDYGSELEKMHFTLKSSNGHASVYTNSGGALKNVVIVVCKVPNETQ